MNEQPIIHEREDAGKHFLATLLVNLNVRDGIFVALRLRL